MIVLTLPDLDAEDQLTLRAHRGDKDALREIYASYYTPIYQFIRMRTDSPDTAEDLAADVFLALVDACRRGKGPQQSLRGWLFRVARHTIHDHYKGGETFTETVLDDWLPIPTDDQPESQFMRTLRIESAQEAIRQLTADQQEVLILRFGQMLSLQETADIMDKQVNAVKQLQLRALQALRRALGTLEVAHD